MTVEAELSVPLATVRLVEFDCTDDDFLGGQKSWHRLDLSRTPRPSDARASYPERWSPHRFERLGDVLFVPAGELLHLRGSPARGHSINCLLNDEAIHAFFEQDFRWTSRSLEASLDIKDGSIRSMIMRLGREASHPGFASQMLAELISGQIVIELFRYSARIEAPATGGLTKRHLRIIDERISEQPAVPALAELAELCGLSVRQLTRAFRVSRGCSIGEYVARRQIDQAKRLLVAGTSIKSISYYLGFSSPSKFSTAFRRHTGQTPRDFRRESPSH